MPANQSASPLDARRVTTAPSGAEFTPPQEMTFRGEAHDRIIVAPTGSAHRTSCSLRKLGPCRLEGKTPRKSCSFASLRQSMTPGAAFALLSMLDVEGQRRHRRRRSAASIGLWRDLLVPTERVKVPCPRGLHRATYQRLVNEYNRVLAALTALSNRKLWPHLRAAYEHQFLNRIVRIRRRLGLPTPEPPARRWYRASDADVRSWSVGGRRVQRSWMVQR
jgi:hypothetical protein